MWSSKDWSPIFGRSKDVCLVTIYASPKCYRMLRKVFILPGLTTLKLCMRNVNIRSGFHEAIFEGPHTGGQSRASDRGAGEHTDTKTVNVTKTNIVNDTKTDIVNHRYWDDQKMFALSLYHTSPKCYRMLRKVFILPALTTLKLCMRNVNIRPGVQEAIYEGPSPMFAHRQRK